MAMKWYICLFVLLTIENLIKSQGECTFGMTSSLQHSLDVSECKKRSIEIGYKCCLITYVSDPEDVAMCFSISNKANLTNLSLNTGLPDDFKVDCETFMFRFSLYIIVLIILVLF